MGVDVSPTAAASGTIDLGDGVEVYRLGFGAMRLTGEEVWGPPDDPDEAFEQLKEAF